MQVWNHFDAGACPGQATGVRVRLDNGLSGYIHIKNLSDRHVTDPTERVRIGQTIHCRILKIDVERFSVDCSSKSSDLLDKNNEWRLVIVNIFQYLRWYVVTVVRLLPSPLEVLAI